MGVKINSQGRTMTAFLEGEIDHHTAKVIRENIDAEVNRKHPSILELDFHDVQFMDSSGIGLIMGRYRIMKLLGGSLKVVRVPDYIDRIIMLSGLGALGVMEKGSEKYENSK